MAIQLDCFVAVLLAMTTVEYHTPHSAQRSRRSVKHPGRRNQLASWLGGRKLKGMSAAIRLEAGRGKSGWRAAFAMLVLAPAPCAVAGGSLDALVDQALRVSLQRLEQSDREAAVVALNASVAQVDGELAAARSTLRQLEYEVEQHHQDEEEAGPDHHGVTGS